MALAHFLPRGSCLTGTWLLCANAHGRCRWVAGDSRRTEVARAVTKLDRRTRSQKARHARASSKAKARGFPGPAAQDGGLGPPGPKVKSIPTGFMRSRSAPRPCATAASGKACTQVHTVPCLAASRHLPAHSGDCTALACLAQTLPAPRGTNRCPFPSRTSAPLTAPNPPLRKHHTPSPDLGHCPVPSRRPSCYCFSPTLCVEEL